MNSPAEAAEQEALLALVTEWCGLVLCPFLRFCWNADGREATPSVEDAVTVVAGALPAVHAWPKERFGVFRGAENLQERHGRYAVGLNCRC